MLKFIGCVLDLVIPGLVVLLVWAGGVELDIVVLLDLVQVNFLSLLLGGVQAELIVLLGAVVLLVDHLLGLLDQVGHELGVSVVGGIEANHLNILDAVIELAQIDGLLVDVIPVKHFLFLLLLKLLSLLLGQSNFFLGGLSLGVLIGLLLRNLNILLNLDLIFNLHRLLIDFLIPLLRVPVVVLHVRAFGLHVVRVVLMRNSLISKLHKSLILSGLRPLLQCSLPLELSLVLQLLLLLELLDVFDFLVEFHFSILLHKIAKCLEWLTLLMLHELEWVVAIGEVIRVIIVIKVDLHILGINQIVLHNFIHFFLV